MDISNLSTKENLITMDDMNKIRILDPEIANKTDKVKTECNTFIESTNNFQQVVDGYLSILKTLQQAVEREKMTAIGANNVIDSLAKDREVEQIQCQTLLMEKAMELERLRIQYQSLLRTEQEQREYIELLLSCK